MFLRNFCYLCPVLFYEGNTSINNGFRFFVFFLGIISWKGALLFSGGCLMGASALMEVLKKSWDGGGAPHFIASGLIS